MNYDKKIAFTILWLLIGIALIVLSVLRIVDIFWGDMGSALLFVGLLQFIKHIRYRRDSNYREKIDTNNQDERNRFISGRAWALSAWIFTLVAAVSSIIFKLLGKEDCMLLSSSAVCLLVFLYWISFLILNKKY